MRQQALLRGAVVIGGDQQQGIGSGDLRFLGVPQCGLRIVRACARDHLHPASGLFGTHGDNLVMLIIVQRRAFARRAAWHQRACAIVDLPVDKAPIGILVKRSVAKWSRQSRYRT